MVTKFIEHFEDKIFKTLYIISHNMYNNRSYQPLRFILTFKSNIVWFFGRKHCTYDMHIYFHASFLGIAFKSFIDDKDSTAQSLCKNN